MSFALRYTKNQEFFTWLEKTVTGTCSIIHCSPHNRIPLSAHYHVCATFFCFPQIFTFYFRLGYAISSYPQKEEGIIMGKFCQSGIPLLLTDSKSMVDWLPKYKKKKEKVFPNIDNGAGIHSKPAIFWQTEFITKIQVYLKFSYSLVNNRS